MAAARATFLSSGVEISNGGREGEPLSANRSTPQKGQALHWGCEGAGNSGSFHSTGDNTEGTRVKALRTQAHLGGSDKRTVGRLERDSDPPRLPATLTLNVGTVPFQTEPTSACPLPPPTFPGWPPPLPQAVPPTGS